MGSGRAHGTVCSPQKGTLTGLRVGLAKTEGDGDRTRGLQASVRPRAYPRQRCEEATTDATG